MNDPNHSQGQSQSRADVTSRIASAGLGQPAQDALVANLDETVLLGCVGVAADQIDASDATLVTVVLDMSSSMSPHSRAVIDAYNTMLRSLASAKSASAILVSAWVFSDAPRLLSGFEAVGQKARLSHAVYAPDGCTALHDAILGAMAGLVSYGQSLWDSGVPTKRVLFVLSDGGDNSSKATARAVSSAARALALEEAYTLAFAGFGDGDLAAVARRLGFTSVIGAAATESDIRAVFRQVSQSVIRVSKGTAPQASGFF